MALSGLIMIGYLLAHMYGNLKVFAGPDAFNAYAHHLRTIGEPILPYAGLLWIIRVVLVSPSAYTHCTQPLPCGRGPTRPAAALGATRRSGHGAVCNGPTRRSPCAGAG